MKQNRTKSPIFWVGMISAALTAVISGATTAGVTLPWWVGAAGMGLSAILAFCNANDPTNKTGF